VLWPWRGRVTADTPNWLELAGTGATGVKRCLHYEIPEKSRSIVGGASVTVCGKKRKGTGKTGNFTGKTGNFTGKIVYIPKNAYQLHSLKQA